MIRKATKEEKQYLRYCEAIGMLLLPFGIFYLIINLFKNKED